MDDAPLALGRFLPYRLSVVTELVSRDFARRYEAAFGIGIPEWRVMAVLGENGPTTTQAVIARTAMDRVRVSRASIRLTDKGLVARSLVKGDARAQTLRLTERGAAIYARIVPLARSLQARLLEALTAEEWTVLDRALAKLQARVAANVEAPADQPATVSNPSSSIRSA